MTFLICVSRPARIDFSFWREIKNKKNQKHAYLWTSLRRLSQTERERERGGEGGGGGEREKLLDAKQLLFDVQYCTWYYGD